MKIYKQIAAIIKTIVFYTVLAATGTLLVSFGTSMAKSRQLVQCVKQSDYFLKQDRPGKALASTQDAEAVAPSYPSYFRALHCNAVRSYARLSKIEKAQKKAEQVYNWNRNKYVPSSTFLTPLASLGDRIVNLYHRVSGIGSNYNKWSGYNALLTELRRTENMEALNKVADRMLAIAPDSRLARKTKVYVKNRKEIIAARENRKHSPDRKTGSRSNDRKNQSTNSTQGNKTDTSSKENKKSGMRSDNPYAEQYTEAKKQYVEFYKTVKKLTAKRDSATGQKRMEYANQLHKMKQQGLSLQRQYQQAARRYKQWNKQNPQK